MTFPTIPQFLTPPSSFLGGQFNGYQSFRKMPGKFFHPPHLVPTDNPITMTTTAARYYVAPWIIEQSTIIAGAWCYNSGAGDNGDKFKIALYDEKSTGGPGALVKNFGEGTFGGSAIVNALSSSVTLAAGRYYLEMVTDNTVAMYCMTAMDTVSGAGYVLPNIAANTMGTLVAPLNSADNAALVVAGDYVGGTYANFPEANSLTPTNSVAGSNVFPFFGLYT